MPIALQGQAVIAGIVLAMVGGGLSMPLIVLHTKLFPLGIAPFAILATAGGTFIRAMAPKSDPDRPIADCRSERQKISG